MESRTLEDNRGLRYTLVLFSRRSRLHPGMRYIARGLNSLASPGNEIECEQVLCTHQADECLVLSFEWHGSSVTCHSNDVYRL